jgi:SSS family solute:Na+ symporter
MVKTHKEFSFHSTERFMHLLGMHVIDLALIFAYFAGMIWIGKRLRARVNSTEEFFIGGRRLGKFFQFLLNFGASTDSSQAVAVSREVYRQGIAGMWIQYLVLFLTPFYWFTSMLLRRSRVITLGDFFTERFESRFLGGAFAVFTIFMVLLGNAVSYLVSAKTFMALTPKPASVYTVEEKWRVESYNEYRELQKLYAEGRLPQTQQARYHELRSLESAGKLAALVSYIKPWQFFVVYGGIVCVYVMLGGFMAAAMTDMVQSVLMILFSCTLLPFGLMKIGGFAGLHAAVPEHMFWLFGAEALSEYAWYTILAMTLANLVSIIAVGANVQVSGSARNENAARFGMIGGLMFKRVMMIFWAFTGLLAIGLYAGQLHDPDLIWGYMTKQLLGPGFIGVMMIGVLAANMSALEMQSVSLAALFLHQIYKPLAPRKTEQHYLLVSRIVIFFILLGGIGMALYVNSLLEIFKYFISVPAIFGAAIWLGFMWRRLSAAAVTIQVMVSFLLIVVIPNLFATWEATRGYEPFLRQTRERQMIVITKALRADVEAGLAARVGERIAKTRVVAPYPIFFDRLVRANPEDPGSRMLGHGRFHAELWVLSWFGVDFTGWNKARLEAARFAFDALFPLLCLIVLSYFTKPARAQTLNRFFAKIHTPIQPTAEEDERAVTANAARMHEFEPRKLFPKTQWEIHRPMKTDYLGFFGTWALVGAIVLLLWLAVNIGAS